MDATPPPGDDEPTPPPASPPPLVEPAAPRRTPGSTAAGPASASPRRETVPAPEPADAPADAAVGEPAASAPAADDGPEDPTVPDTAVEATLASEPAGTSPEEPVVPTTSPDEVRVAAPAPQPDASATADSPTTDPANTGSPDSNVPATGPLQREVVYVPAPNPPKQKGNRGIGALIAAVSAFVFLFVYALVSLLIRGVMRGDTRIEFLADVSFYIPVLLFTAAFVLLALIVNRAGWWSFVLGSLFVGAFVYFGTIGVLLLNQAASLTPAAAGDQFRQYLINPLVIAAGLVAREVALWVGAGISARGRRVKARNAEVRENFEREQAERRAEIERDGSVVRTA